MDGKKTVCVNCLTTVCFEKVTSLAKSVCGAGAQHWKRQQKDVFEGECSGHDEEVTRSRER